MATTDQPRSRLVEAAAAILADAPGRQLNIVCLNKALFYLDLIAIRDTGTSVTNSGYIALQNGPVVAKYDKKLVRELEKAGLAIQQMDGMAKPMLLTGEAQKDWIPLGLQETVRKLAKWAAETTSTEASEFSHMNPGWIVAWTNGLGERKPPQKINMQLVLQQMFADPWDAEDDEEEEDRALHAALELAEQGEAVAWE